MYSCRALRNVLNLLPFWPSHHGINHWTLHWNLQSAKDLCDMHLKLAHFDVPWSQLDPRQSVPGSVRCFLHNPWWVANAAHESDHDTKWLIALASDQIIWLKPDLIAKSLNLPRRWFHEIISCLITRNGGWWRVYRRKHKKVHYDIPQDWRFTLQPMVVGALHFSGLFPFFSHPDSPTIPWTGLSVVERREAITYR